MKKTIEVKNRGPVRNCTIEIPEDGGVVVLTGDNGSGKSEALAGIDRLLGRKDKGTPLTATDGTERGYIQGLGVKVTFGRQTRQSGKLVVESLEDRLNISDVIDPPIKDPKAADALRVKGLLQMAAGPDGVTVEDLVGVLPAAALAQVEHEIENVSDAVELTALVKRSFEKTAREFEATAVSARDQAKGLQTHENFEGVDISTSVAKENVADAIQSRAAVNARIDVNRAMQKSIGEYEGKSSKETAEEIAFIDVRIKAAKERVIHYGAELLKWEREMADADALVEPTEAAHKAAIEVEEFMAELGGRGKALDDRLDMKNADKIVREAELASERATLRDAAVKNDKAAALLIEKAEADSVVAGQNRLWATSAEESLSSRLREATGGKLFVDDSRVCTMTSRGLTPFATLSQGERTKIVMELAAGFVGANGMFVADQIFWESLDATNRKLVVDLAVELGVVIVTAEATPTEDESGELHSKVLT